MVREQARGLGTPMRAAIGRGRGLGSVGYARAVIQNLGSRARSAPQVWRRREKNWETVRACKKEQRAATASDIALRDE
eukprot:4468352-Pleurochrysis_carterae.AAC.1